MTIRWQNHLQLSASTEKPDPLASQVQGVLQAIAGLRHRKKLQQMRFFACPTWLVSTVHHKHHSLSRHRASTDGLMPQLFWQRIQQQHRRPLLHTMVPVRRRTPCKHLLTNRQARHGSALQPKTIKIFDPFHQSRPPPRRRRGQGTHTGLQLGQPVPRYHRCIPASSRLK